MKLIDFLQHFRFAFYIFRWYLGDINDPIPPSLFRYTAATCHISYELVVLNIYTCMFGIFRDPNPLLEDGGIKWSRFTEEERKYVRLMPPLDSSCSRDHFRAKKMAFWNDYLPYLQQNTPCSHQRSKTQSSHFFHIIRTKGPVIYYFWGADLLTVSKIRQKSSYTPSRKNLFIDIL